MYSLCFKVPYEIVGRRPGDVANVYADTKLAEEELGWKAEKGLKEMCKSDEQQVSTHITNCFSFNFLSEITGKRTEDLSNLSLMCKVTRSLEKSRVSLILREILR